VSSGGPDYPEFFTHWPLPGNAHPDRIYFRQLLDLGGPGLTTDDRLCPRQLKLDYDGKELLAEVSYASP
jgi:hypothetical protein